MTVIDCPECRQGKHQNCTVTVLCDDDIWRACPCAVRGHVTIQFQGNEAVINTPYAGSSGHSGSLTSKERADTNDASGATANSQYRVAALVFDRGYRGLTVKEARTAFPQWHHGTISGALSVLHKAGTITRLTARREGCEVYVDPVYVRGRETVAQGRIRVRHDGFTVLAPGVLLSDDGETITYQGKNYVRSNDGN